MATITLTEGGKAYPLNYKLLAAMAENLPDSAAYDGLASELLELGIPSISEKLVGRDSVTAKQRDALWAGGNIDIRRALIHEYDFLAHLTDQQANDLIADNDTEALKRVALYAELLYPDRDRVQADRLSGTAADALIMFIHDHEDPAVRSELAENAATPLKFLPPFRDCVKHGSYNVKCMTKDDLPLLDSMPRAALEHLADNIEDIEDDLQREVGKLLAAHFDPSVRLALAENKSAPRAVLRPLMKDREPDVVAAARESLGVLDDDE